MSLFCVFPPKDSACVYHYVLYNIIINTRVIKRVCVCVCGWVWVGGCPGGLTGESLGS